MHAQLTEPKLTAWWNRTPDAVLPALVAVPLVVWTMTGGTYYGYQLFPLLGAAGVLLGLLWRRSRPNLAGGVALGGAVLYLLGNAMLGLSPGGFPMVAALALLVLFAVSRHSNQPIVWAVVPGLAVTGFGLLSGAVTGSTWLPDGQIITVNPLLAQAAYVGLGVLAVGAAWGLGRWAHQRDERGLAVLPGDSATNPQELKRQWWDHSPYGKDLALAAVFFVVTLPWAINSMSWSQGFWMSYDVYVRLGVVLALGYTLPLIWRRSHPDWACVAAIPVHAVQLFMPSMFLFGNYGYFWGLPVGNLVVPLLLFSAARSSKYANIWLGVGLAASVVAGARWATRYYWVENLGNPRALLAGVISVAVVIFACVLAVVASWSLGRMRRYQHDTAGLALGRAQALASEQEKIRLLAAEQERSRIAREMHDIVAHSLSVIVVQADGAGYTLSQPGDQSRQLVVAASALEVIGSTARTALAETRRLVGVLRDDEQADGLAPMVNLAALPALLDRTRAAGLPLEACFEGSPDEHAPLGAGVEAAAYRIVQESLTNVMKHAGPGAFATVLVEHTNDGLHLEIRDDGRGPGRNDGRGHGLIGMRERVGAFGGTLVTQARQPNGFEVIATLPAQQQAVTADGRLAP